MKYSGELYVTSTKKHEEWPEVDYPFHNKIITLTYFSQPSGLYIGVF